MLGATDALHALVRPVTAIVTVAILAQGTSWADAVTQAFWDQARIPPATLDHNVKKHISKKPNPDIGEHLILLNADRHGSFQETSVRGGEMKTPLVQTNLLHDTLKVLKNQHICNI